MHVGVVRATFRLAGNRSLKGKRRISRSVIDRLRGQFDVAAAEVGEADAWQRLTVGIACVSNEGQQARQVLDRVVRFLEQPAGEWELIDIETETIPRH